jgi:hypothetical protein
VSLYATITFYSASGFNCDSAPHAPEPNNAIAANCKLYWSPISFVNPI